MKTGRFRVALLIAVLTLAVLAPATAMASAWFNPRGLLGLSLMADYNEPDISGSNIIYTTRSTAIGAKWYLRRFNLTSGGTYTFVSDAVYDLQQPAISGDWVVWTRNHDIRAKNIKTGTTKNVTNDGGTTDELAPQVSGNYVVWQAWDGSSWNVKAKNLTTTGSPFTVAAGSANQWSPSIYGKRVAYLDNSNGHSNVYVKTIGSSAAPKKITDNGINQFDPSIGDHLVAWRVTDGDYMIRYFNYYTGETYNGPTNAAQPLLNPQVAGDRILYNISNGSDQDLYVWDARVAKASAPYASFLLADSTANDHWGKISGNSVAYMSGSSPYKGRLAAPSISLASVPKRIRHGARLHLKGSITDQGQRIGGAKLGIERYGSGKWSRIKTITASSTGSFSYYTPKNYSKKQYRVVYDGVWVLFQATARNHLSTVSGSKTAWPR